LIVQKLKQKQPQSNLQQRKKPASAGFLLPEIRYLRMTLLFLRASVMWLVDELAEQHIKAALEKGELSNLPGSGKPLQLDDDSHVPPELRAGYRLLKNSGFLPPELELRREAMEVNDLIRQLDPADRDYQDHCHRLQVLELRLRQAGMSTDFLHGNYATAMRHHFREEE